MTVEGGQRGGRDPYRWPARLTLVIFALTLPVTFVAIVAAQPAREAEATTQRVDSEILNEFGSAKALVTSEMFKEGHRLFAGTCISCHTERGRSRPSLGKDLVASEWVGQQTDEELIAYIKQGRDPGDPLNTTGVGMPPKGGNPALNDEKIRKIVAYIRGLRAIDRGEVSESVAFDSAG